jgi:anti-sigma-K factor RskA
MIEERYEELASLYAFDLLEGEELHGFEAALARDPELGNLVRSLRETSARFAYSVSTPAPVSLRTRVLANLKTQTAGEPAPGQIIRPPLSLFRSPQIPWAVAACLAVLAAWLGQRAVTAHGELSQLRRQNALADVTLQSVRQQLEADRIVAQRQIETLNRDLQSEQLRLAEARAEVVRSGAQLAALNDRARAAGDYERQLAEARRGLAERETQVASLSQRVDALAGASAELGRQLELARDRMGQLASDMLRERELADFKISVLASLAREHPQALAVAVWDSSRKEGVLKVENLPALAPTQDYQLWVVDPQYKDPVDGGVFTVTPGTGEARLTFTAKQPVAAVNAFAISLERKGGVPKAEGPILLLGK